MVELLEAAVRDLAAQLDLPLASTESVEVDRVRWQDPEGLIGFAGKSAAGTVAVSAPWTLLRATHPVKDATEDELLDWSRELANLLLGSFKHTLMRRGVLIEMGLPSTVLGEAVELRTGSPAGVAIIGRTETAGELSVFLDTAFAPDVTLPTDDVDGGIGGLGDVLF